ncbi:MAG: FtsX-like permease family protein [Syntrophotaleaceae bacterium]
MNLANLLRHISLKHLKHQKAQTIMAVAGIALGVAAIVSIGIVNKSVLRSFEDSFIHATGRASLQVTGAQSGFPEAILEQVQAVPGVEYAVPVIDTEGLLSAGQERSLMILGVDVLIDGQIRDYSLSNESADIPDPLLFLARPDSIIITKTMAEREQIALDQQIQVETVQGTRTFRVRGILNPEGPAKVMGGNLAVMDIYAAQMAFGKEGRIDRVDVSLLRGEDLETVKRRILAALPEGYSVETPVGRTRQIESMLANFQTGLNLISFFAIIVGMYLIYNAVSISIVHRRKEIGILRALGATRGQIMQLFLGETLVISAVGSALGVGLGILFAGSVVGTLGKIVSQWYARTAVTGIELTWVYPAAGIACGIAASLAAAVFPVLASNRISPVSAIRSVPWLEEGFFTGKRLNITAGIFLLLAAAVFCLYKFSDFSPVFKNGTFLFSAQLFLILGISFFTPAFLKGFLSLFHRFLASRLGSMGRLAGLNLQKNITRNAVAVAAIFFGISVFVNSAGYVHSSKESVMTWLDAVVRADIIVSAGHPSSSTNAQTVPMPVEMWRDIEEVPGVRSADPWRKLYMDYNGQRVLLSTIDIVRRGEYSHFIVTQGDGEEIRRLLPHQDNIVVSEPFATRFGLKPGDVITLATPSGPVRFGITAVVVDYLYDSGTVIFDLFTFQRHWGDMLADQFSVRVVPGADIPTVRDAIQKRLGGDRKLFVLPVQEFKDEIRKAMDGTFVFNYALSVITMTIACFGIIVTLLASVLERTREVGILRSIGMLRRQVTAVVLIESLLMGAAGGLLGCGAGVITGWLNLEGSFRANYSSAAQYFIPYGSIAWALVLAAGLSALAGIYPARRAAKTDVVEALTYE